FPQNTVLANHCGGSCCAYESCGCPSTGCGPTSECSAETGHNPDGSCSTLGSCEVRTFGTYCGGSPNPTNTPTPTTQPTPTSQPTPTPQTYLVAGGNVFCQDPGGPKYNLPSIQILLHNDVVAAPNNNRTIFTNSGGNYSFGNIISGEVNNFLAFRVNYVPPTNTIPGTGQPYSAMILDSAPNCTNSNQCDFGGVSNVFCNASGTSYELCGLSGTTTTRYGLNIRLRNCTPGTTPTPTTHPSVTPSVTTIPTPPAPMCHNITPLSPAPHQIGDNVSYESGLITTPYE